MLESKTPKDWEIGYNGARILLQADPEKACKLEEVYNNPGYYAGYCLFQLEGSLGRQGDSHAEQNHASIVAHLGKGGNFDLEEQVQKLIEPHQAKVRQRMNANSDLTIRINRFSSSFRTPQDKIIDEKAHSSLSSHAYKTFFQQAFQHSRRLQHRLGEDGTYAVWGANIPASEIEPEKVNYLSETSRCQCSKRKQFLIQCGHELNVFGFGLKLWDSRWMNERTYCSGVTNLYAQGFFDQPQLGDSDFLEVEDDKENEIVQDGASEDEDEMKETLPIDLSTEVAQGDHVSFTEVQQEVQQTQTDHVSFTEVQQTLT
jgi:hypothetical protein